MTQDKMIIDRYRNEEGGYDDVVRPHNDFFRVPAQPVGESVGLVIPINNRTLLERYIEREGITNIVPIKTHKITQRMAHLLRVILENHKERQADGDPTNLNDTIANQIEKILEEYDERTRTH